MRRRRPNETLTQTEKRRAVEQAEQKRKKKIQGCQPWRRRVSSRCLNEDDEDRKKKKKENRQDGHIERWTRYHTRQQSGSLHLLLPRARAVRVADRKRISSEEEQSTSPSG